MMLCVGRKGRAQLARDFGGLIVDTIEDIGRPQLGFDDAQGIANVVLGMFEDGTIDVCTIIYNRFVSAIRQIVTRQQLIPFAPPKRARAGPTRTRRRPAAASGAVYEYEPDEAEILAELLPLNLSVQVFRALLENNASEQGARMAAMDNATRNAGDMIDRLTLNYNRTRQAASPAN